MHYRYHPRCAVRRIASVLLILLTLLAAAVPVAARACALDGVVSMAVNGRLAARTPFAPTAKTRATWTPFLLNSHAPGGLLRFTEDRAKLRRSLPATALTQPFRWDYGDGATSTGRQGVHRYRRAGVYKVTVQAYWPSRRRWALFDSAQIAILPPAPPAPLERVRAALLSAGIYGGPVAGGLLLLWGWRRSAWRRRRSLHDTASSL